MNIGKKIAKYRLFKNWTQKELGEKIGINNNPNVRINQYELGLRTPKDDLKEQLADVLDVDAAFFREHNINSATDAIHALFDIEDLFDMELVSSEDDICVKFKQTEKNKEFLKYLSLVCAKKNYPKDSNCIIKNSLSNYDIFKSKFPSNYDKHIEKKREEFWNKYNNIPLCPDTNPLHFITDFIEPLKKLTENRVLLGYSYYNDRNTLELLFDYKELMGQNIAQDEFFMLFLESQKRNNINIDIDYFLLSKQQLVIKYSINTSMVFEFSQLLHNTLNYVINEKKLDFKPLHELRTTIRHQTDALKGIVLD